MVNCGLSQVTPYRCITLKKQDSQAFASFLDNIKNDMCIHNVYVSHVSHVSSYEVALNSCNGDLCTLCRSLLSKDIIPIFTFL